MSTTNGIHAGQHLVGLVDHEVGTLGDDREVVVGDDRGDLDDHVRRVVEPRHLQIHPHEHPARLEPVVALPRELGHHGWMTPFADLLAAPGVEEVVDAAWAVRVHGVPRWCARGDDRRDRRRRRRAIGCLAVRGDPAGRDARPPRLDEDPSRRVAAARRVPRATSTSSITIHGFGQRGLFGSLLLGGGNRPFAEHVGCDAAPMVAGLRRDHRPRRDPRPAPRPARRTTR